MTFKTRAAIIEDAQDIASVHVAAWKVAYKGLIHQSYLDGGKDRLDVSARRKSWEENLRKDRKTYELFVALDENRIIGFADVGPCRDAGREDCAEIYAIYLDPAYYSQGAGQLLFQECLSQIKKLNYKNLIIWVLDTNQKARAFYERMGGVFQGVERPAPLDGHTYREACYEWANLK